MTETFRKEKVYAVVVTYNRLSLLQKSLEALANQTLAPTKIIVVNNDSTDGTKEWLSTQRHLVVIHQDNVGGAGGFHTGTKAAYEDGAGWVWLQDDDVLPDPDCLEQMFKHAGLSSCINPIHYAADGTLPDEERWFDLTDCTILNLYNQSHQYGKATWYRNLGSFEGMIVSRDLIQKIGFPDPRFFIAHDDLIYGFLASKHTNVLVVRDAVMRRQPVNRTGASAINYTYYYMMRNLWLLEEYAAKELPDFNGYRRRRIRWQFLYTVYKIFFVDKPDEKAQALKTLWTAYRHYKQKRGGRKP